VDVAFIVLGFFAFSSQGVTGGVLEMVNHGLTTGAIFFLVGVIWERRGTLRFSDLGGLQKSMPILGSIFLAVVMSAIGLPGLNGFVGEFLVLVGTFVTHRWWAVVGTVAIITAAIYMLWAYQRVFQGRITNPANETVRDISWREIGAVAPLLAGIVFLGVYPRPFLDRVTPSVDYMLNRVERIAPNADVPASTTRNFTLSVPANQDVMPGAGPGGSSSQSAASSLLPPATSSGPAGSPSTGSPSTGSPSTGSPSTGSPSTGSPSTGSPSTGSTSAPSGSSSTGASSVPVGSPAAPAGPSAATAGVATGGAR
jgi:hypothetical protein